ncbi:hypothetical protein, partial [Novosphingobium sp.]|uniref:hypothetical protein n=1 Tax=Novosphingobium sp. TaxID=1874826 RepID=UPI0028AA8A9F
SVRISEIITQNLTVAIVPPLAIQFGRTTLPKMKTPAESAPADVYDGTIQKRHCEVDAVPLLAGAWLSRSACP